MSALVLVLVGAPAEIEREDLGMSGYTEIGADLHPPGAVGLDEANRGGNVRNIDTSKMYLFGSVSKDDKGDLAAGGPCHRPGGQRRQAAAPAGKAQSIRITRRRLR